MAMAAIAHGAPISIFSTGVNGVGATTPIGTVDSHWELSAKPGSSGLVLGSNPFRFNCCYVADNGISGWVSPGLFGGAGASGIYEYTQEFDLTGFDLSTVVLSGAYSTDNDGELLINSTIVLTTGFSGFGSLHAWSAPVSALLPGINTIRARVNNGGDPTALRVEIRSATGDLESVGVPEPSTGLLVLAGAGLAILARRRRG
jgi:hypothetical protein